MTLHDPTPINGLMRRHLLATAAILIALSGCDNVEWGGVEMELTPPPVAEPGTPAEVPPPEPAPPEVARPLLLAGSRADAAATLVVVGELADGVVVPPTQTSLASGATEGSEWILFTDGVRVGRMTAETVGPATAAVINTLMTRRRHPEQGYRSCLGVLRLERYYGPARLEAACRRAQAIDAVAYKSVQSILKTGLDHQPLPEPVSTVPLPIEHDHLRGTTYYQQEGDC